MASVLMFCTGFRVFQEEQPWRDLSRASAASSKLFVSFNITGSLINDLPDSDPLSGTETITVNQAMQSILDDFNGISASYVRLVDTSDPDYIVANAQTKTITIDVGSASGLSSGEARFEYEGDKFIGCKITVIDSQLEEAVAFIGLMTHELGHCVGLDHPQELTDSVMSYFSPREVHRLRADDKMGIAYLYPLDAGKGRESPTLGASCSRR